MDNRKEFVKNAQFPSMRVNTTEECIQTSVRMNKWSADFADDQFDFLCATFYPAGQHFRYSKEAAVEALCSENAKVRYLALNALTFILEKSRDVAEVCGHLAKNDPDLSVRSSAISYLRIFHSGTANLTVAKLLASIVASDAEDEFVRTSAYCALARVLNGDHVSSLEIADRFRFPKDVDWPLVRAILACE